MKKLEKINASAETLSVVRIGNLSKDTPQSTNLIWFGTAPKLTIKNQIAISGALLHQCHAGPLTLKHINKGLGVAHGVITCLAGEDRWGFPNPVL